MATTTPNFGWPVPTSSDLVKNGATAIEALGDGIDASLLDLKGGTSGQVLKKNSNTDMDFVWSSDSAGMTNPMTTTGDTIYSSSGSTPARLGIGSTGQVLTVASGVPSWATPAGGGGKVLQVVSATTTTATTIATTTLTDTTITATITPTSATSKILVIISAVGYLYRGVDGIGSGAQLLRGATAIQSWTSPNFLYNVSTGLNVNQAITCYDNPATTSATTYKLQAKVETTANGQGFLFQNDAPSTITLLEIGA
jgi:hypothetical protein